MEEERLINNLLVLSSTCQDIRGGYEDWQTLLHDLASSSTSIPGGIRLLLGKRSGFLSRNPNIYVLWITHTQHTGPLSVLEASVCLQQLIDSKRKFKQKSLLVTMKTSGSTEKLDGPFGNIFLLSCAELSGTAEQANGLTARERYDATEFIAEQRSLTRLSWKRNFVDRPRQKLQTMSVKKRIAYSILMLLSLLTLTGSIYLIVNKAYHHTGEKYWHRYHLNGSKGNQIQLEVNRHNVTEFVTEHPEKVDWFVRLDDQSIIHPSLVTEEEEQYQRWFRKRYPEWDNVIKEKKYVDPDFLNSLKIVLPSDTQSHFAHCVLTLRRYWWAKESGHHVCPRDIDHYHIKHCLDRLDEKAFIDGDRDASEGYALLWKTKVCF